jgi:predicted heme/steroid binding protein
LNGKEGRPVYIAFEGKVYDVSKSPLWSKKFSFSFLAGPEHPPASDDVSYVK